MQFESNTNKNGILSLKFVNIIIWFYGVRATIDVWLAFAQVQYSPVLYWLKIFFVYVTPLLGVPYVFHKRIFSLTRLRMILPIFIYWLFQVFHTYGGYQGDYIIALIAISCFMLMEPEIKREAFRTFYWIVQITNIIAILVYLFFILGINIGFSTVPYYEEFQAVRGYVYYKWFAFAIFSRPLSGFNICSIFNEPGALATCCAFLFIATNRYSKIWEKVVLLLTIFLTFSLAGYILLFGYFAIYMYRKNWKNIIWIAAFAVFFLNIPNIDWGNAQLNALAQRMAITNGSLAGDNRFWVDFEAGFNQLRDEGALWLGKGAGYVIQTAAPTSTYRTWIVQYGYIGFIIFLTTWVLCAYRETEGNKDCIIVLILFLVSVYQRPLAITNVYGYVYCFGSFEWIKWKALYSENSNGNRVQGLRRVSGV